MTSPRKDILLSVLIFFVFLVIYIHNLSASVYGGDVGDLVSSIVVKGVPHPPGYPLFTVLGILVNALPLDATPAYKVGLLSAISSACTVVLTYLIAKKVSNARLLSVLTASTLGFFYYFWLYAEVAEVFALNTFFAALLLLLALEWYSTQKKKFFYLFSFCLGLSFSHHHTIILVLPCFLFFLMKSLFPLKRLIQEKKTIFLAIAFVLLGMGFYLYIPVAASFDPPINWGHATTLERFIRVFLRTDYGTFSSGPFATPTWFQRYIELKSYLHALAIHFTLPGSMAILVGIGYTLWKKREIGIPLLVAFCISGPLFLFYAGFPIVNEFVTGMYERFFLLSSFFIALFLPFGVQAIAQSIGKIMSLITRQEKWWYATVVSLLFFIIPLSLFRYNFPKTNLSSIWVGDILGHDYLAAVPPKSLVLIGGDTQLFNTQYVYYGKQFRRDVILLNLFGLKDQSFFVTEYNKITKAHLYKNDLDNMLATLVSLARTRPVYAASSLQFTKEAKEEKLQWVQKGLLKQLVITQKPEEAAYTKEIEKIWSNFGTKEIKQEKLQYTNQTLASIKHDYARAALFTGSFYITEYKNQEKALKWYKEAQSFDPNYAEVYKVMASFYFDKKDCTTAAEYLKKAIDLDRSDSLSYFLLYSITKDCLHDEKKATAVAQLFSRNIGRDFTKEVQYLLEEYKKNNE